MTDERRIVAIRKEPVAGHEHVTKVKLADDTVEDVADVIRAIDEHDAHYTMTPPEGAPAHEAHLETGLPLLVQVIRCPDCNERILFA